MAALSNDPVGQFNHKITYDINYLGTIKLAKFAKKMGVNISIDALISWNSTFGMEPFFEKEVTKG